MQGNRDLYEVMQSEISRTQISTLHSYMCICAYMYVCMHIHIYKRVCNRNHSLEDRHKVSITFLLGYFIQFRC